MPHPLRRASLPALLLLCCGLFACPKNKPLTPPPPPAPPASLPAPAKTPTARILFVDCKPADATVEVDDVERGTVDQLSMNGGLEVSLGVHRIVVRRAGFESYRVELSVGEKGERISIQLARKRRRRR